MRLQHVFNFYSNKRSQIVLAAKSATNKTGDWNIIDII
jgi:hypothetical protein